MFKKGYLLTFAGLLAIIIALQQPSYVPNQEIVLEFDNENSYQAEAKRTIATLKRELHAIGITQIVVFANKKNYTLTLSYYSKNDVVETEKRLAKSRHIGFIQKKGASPNEQKLPFKNNKNYEYTVAVHIIDASTYTSKVTSKLGILQWERIKIDPLQLKNPGFFNDQSYAIVNFARYVQNNISCNTSGTYHSICNRLPESRAGPLS